MVTGALLDGINNLADESNGHDIYVRSFNQGICFPKYEKINIYNTHTSHSRWADAMIYYMLGFEMKVC